MFGQERNTIEQAFPGDVVGLTGAGDLRVGDSSTPSGRLPSRPCRP
jgi:peptide subunit release factor RF-3